MNFETGVDSIMDELELRLKEVEKLQNRVYRGQGNRTEYPYAEFILERVEVEAEGDATMVSNQFFEYTLIFLLSYRGELESEETGELNEKNKIARVGEVLDKLKEYTVHYPKWDLLWTPNIEWAQLRRQANTVLMDCDIELRVRRKW